VQRGAGWQKRSQNEISNDEDETIPAEAFIDDAAAKTGKGRATVARDAKRGRDGKERLRDVPPERRSIKPCS